MTHLHAITDRGADLTALLREQQGGPSFRNPARRAAFMIAQRVAEGDQWHHSSANAADFLRAFACIANKMANSSGRPPGAASAPSLDRRTGRALMQPAPPGAVLGGAPPLDWRHR